MDIEKLIGGKKFVPSIDFNQVVKCDNLRYWRISRATWERDKVELHITFEKDGKWYKLATKRAYLYITKDTKVNDEFLVCVGLDMHNLASVSFVHELQHLLYGLKINSRYCYCTLPCDVYNNYKNKLLT